MNEKISVIVPVYNVEKYLRKCLESIVNQTYKNLEIILVDDGSKDNSGAICDEYAAKDSRIIVVHKKNKGVSAARKIGYLKSTGDILAFVDSDDYIDINMYSDMMKHMTDDKCDIVICKYININKDKSTIRKWPGTDKFFDKEEALKYLARDDIKSFFWDKIFKKNKINENNFMLNCRFEDFLVMHDIFYKCNKIKFINKAFYCYCRNEESFTKNIHSNIPFFLVCLSRLKWYEKYCPKYLNDIVIRTANVAVNCFNEENITNDQYNKLNEFVSTNIKCILFSFRISFKDKIRILKYYYKVIR